ncbi:hypothetical protein JCM8097_001666 [Rhodosporidiobolus ruineniae]
MADRDKDDAEFAHTPSASSQAPSREQQQSEEDAAEEEVEDEEIQDEREQEQEAQGDGDGVSGWLSRKLGMKRKKVGRRGGDVEAVGAAGEDFGWELPQVETRTLPILSGLVCPFSVLLDIPGLTTRWYVRTDDHVVIETQPNPAILDIGLAISLALGVLANLALILRFLEHRPRLCTWISMLSLSLHDIINVTAVTAFAVVHAVDDGFTYGSAFWLTVASTAMSMVCNVTLILDLVFTKDFDKKGSGLTEKQRTLVIATMVLLLYLGIGAISFHYLIPGQDFIAALYFTIVTISTVGFGDIVPVTVRSRIFSLFYDPIGIILLGLTIALARECLIESFEQSYRTRRDKLAKKARERKEERRRRHEERRKREEETRSSGEKEVEQGGMTAAASHAARRVSLAVGSTASPADEGKKNGSTTVTSAGSSPAAISPTEPGSALAELVFAGQAAAAHGTASASSPLSPLSPPTTATTSSFPASFSRIFRHPKLPSLPQFFRRRLPAFTASPRSLTPSTAPGAIGSQPGDRDGGASLRRTLSVASSVDDSFRLLKVQLAKEQKQEFRVKLGISIFLFLVFWLVGAAVFQATEKWTYFEALWFGFVYFTTIGYGDLSPKSEGGRAFFCCWALLGIANMAVLISILTESFSSRYKSTITSGRVKRAARRMYGGRYSRKNGGGANQSSGAGSSRFGSKPPDSPSSPANGGETRRPSVVNELLQSEGYEPLGEGGSGGRRDDESVAATGVPVLTAEELPAKVVETLKGFHEHARYFMLGRHGTPPAHLRVLLDAAEADELDGRLPRVLGDLGGGGGATSLADVGAQGDVKQYLFLVAYERSFDALVDSAEQLAGHFAGTKDELERLRAKTEELEARLAVVEGEDASIASPRPMHKDEDASEGGLRRPDDYAGGQGSSSGGLPQHHLPRPALNPVAGGHSSSRLDTALARPLSQPRSLLRPPLYPFAVGRTSRNPLIKATSATFRPLDPFSPVSPSTFAFFLALDRSIPLSGIASRVAQSPPAPPTPGIVALLCDTGGAC